MPLVAYAIASYVTGLYAGFAGSLLLAAITALVATYFGYRRASVVAAGYAALAIAGALVARTAVADDDICVAGAIHRGVMTLIIDDSVAPGGFTRGQLVNCNGIASMSVVEGSAAAGAHVVARGTILRTERGLLIQRASVTLTAQPSPLRRMRAAAGRSIDRTFRDDAPLVRALLIADRSELAPEVRDRFAAAGLAHILAIAGLHIGIIAMALTLAFESAGIARRPATIVTMVVVIAYVAMIGAPVPAVRSATMLALLLVTRLMQRPTSRWAIVALGASQAMLSPRVVLDVGYQLSVVGVSAMIAAGQLGRRIGVDRLPALRRTIAATLLGTTVATIGSAPIVALVFGRLSLVAPLSNLAATPLIAMAQPMIFLGLIVSPLPMIARYVADAAHPFLFGLQWTAQYSAALPYASVDVAPSVPAAVVAGAMSLAVIVACASRDWHRPAAMASTAAAALIWLPLAPGLAGSLEIHMIDVGQGDAIALRTPHGHWVLIDAGGAWNGGDAGRNTVVPYVGRRGGDVDVFILSHPHTDHVGGAASVFRVLHPPMYVDAGFPGGADAYRSSLQVAHDARIRWVRAHPGDSLLVDGVSLRMLAPDSTWTAGLVDPNLASVVVVAQYGNVRALFMGDAERAEEQWILDRDRDALAADILKVGHHGSGTSTSEAFLAAVQPRLALVSVGAGNSYHLPTPAVMQRLAASGAQVLRTDRLGTIVAHTDGRRIWVHTAGDEWELPPRLPTP